MFFSVVLISGVRRSSDLPFHHHFHSRGIYTHNGKPVEHLYLNSEAVRSLPVGTFGRDRRDVEDEGSLTFTQTLSRNVTRILEELLMGYDQTERPPSKGKMLEILIYFAKENEKS